MVGSGPLGFLGERTSCAAQMNREDEGVAGGVLVKTLSTCFKKGEKAQQGKGDHVLGKGNFKVQL